MFKVGDRVVSTGKNKSVYFPYGHIGIITAIKNNSIFCITNRFIVDAGLNIVHRRIGDIVSEDVFNSPLYQLMKEEE